MSSQEQEVEKESLKDQVEHTEEEARMVLPGIQALFGFQLIAVFNQRFTTLSEGERLVHLFALFSSALATLLILAPAAYHRQAERGQVSRYLTAFGSTFLALGMVPLMTGICLDFWIIARMIIKDQFWSGFVSLALFLGFAGTWFAFPQYRKRRYRRRLESEAKASALQKRDAA